MSQILDKTKAAVVIVEPCYVCNGKTVNPENGHPCMTCDGTGELTHHVPLSDFAALLFDGKREFKIQTPIEVDPSCAHLFGIVCRTDIVTLEARHG